MFSSELLKYIFKRGKFLPFLIRQIVNYTDKKNDLISNDLGNDAKCGHFEALGNSFPKMLSTIDRAPKTTGQKIGMGGSKVAV